MCGSGMGIWDVVMGIKEKGRGLKYSRPAARKGINKGLLWVTEVPDYWWTLSLSPFKPLTTPDDAANMIR